MIFIIRNFRYRSIENVAEEIRYFQDRYNIDHVVIADDTFGLKKGRLEALCETFGTLGLKSWNSNARVDSVNRESLKMMKQMGCTKVSFGVETGSERVIALNQKKIELSRVREAVREAHDAGIRHVEANFIVGSHPDETLEDLKMTGALIRELPLSLISVSVIVPYPGTSNYDIFVGRGYLYTKDWSKFVMFGKTPEWRTAHFSPGDLLRHQKRLNRNFYLNPGYMTRMLLKIDNLGELGYYLKAGKAFVKWVLGGSVVPEGSDAMDLRDEGFLSPP